LTASASQPRLDSAAPRQPLVTQHRSWQIYLLTAAFAGSQLAGVAAVVQAYHVAQTTLSNESEFAWFWAGMLLIELPIAGLIVRRATPRPMRPALLLLLGLVTYLPKLLRSPAGPVYHDEFAHWRATYEILSTGRLFEPNPIIPIISRYPGLHAATAALVNATGLTIWQAATLLLILFHVAMVIGIAALAQSLGLDNRTAALAAVFYGLNSSFLYFDTEFAYESMAITLLVWVLVGFVRAIRAQSGREKAAWGVLAVALSAATVATHHLSAITLVLIMVLVSVAVSVPQLARGEGWVKGVITAWSLTLVTTAMAGAWFYFVAPGTLSYLSPYPAQSLQELTQAIRGSGSVRQLFGTSLSPWWEDKSAYLVPVFAVGLAIVGLLVLRAWIKSGRLTRGRRRALMFAFALVGLAYFPSTIFILAPSGAEGARRSWAFLWIGLCMLFGPAAVWLVDWTARQTSLRARASLRLGLFAALAIALIGGVAAGVDASYRFPGPFLYGSDSRSVTPELLGTSEWFSAHLGTGNNVVTDRNTGLIFGSFGLQNLAVPSAGFPAYNLYLVRQGAQLYPPYLQFELSGSGYHYLIVDGRMAYEVPESGVYFERNEPSFMVGSGGRVFRVPLAEFTMVPWMLRAFQSDNYSIYRLELPIQNSKVGYQPKVPKERGRLVITR
jgi:hypothetical protein